MQAGDVVEAIGQGTVGSYAFTHVVMVSQGKRLWYRGGWATSTTLLPLHRFYCSSCFRAWLSLTATFHI
jgi:hypothetical protein